MSSFSSSRQGFFGHGSLALAMGDVACPLGIVAYQPYVHKKQISENSKEYWEEQGGVMDNELVRWIRGVERAEKQLDGCESVLHFFDAEGDAYELLKHMEENNRRYICRMASKRRVIAADGSKGSLHGVVRSAPVRTTCEAWVSKRRPTGMPKSRKPARTKHLATLEVRAVRLTIRRPESRTPTTWPTGIKLNVVHVFEPHPVEGEEPVEWFLATTEPIETIEEVEAIVNRYKQRWLIEEFHKTIKTGCSFTKR